MAKNKPTARRREKRQRLASAEPKESPTADAATVAWTVAVTMVVVCDFAAVAAHWYVLGNPAAKGAAMFGGLMLFGGAVIGTAALVLLPIVYRVRRAPPPTGFTVFAVCASAAPILALIARSLLP